MIGLTLYPEDIRAPVSGIDRSSIVSDGGMTPVSGAYTHVGIMPLGNISDGNGRFI